MMPGSDETERAREALDVVSRYGAACVRYGEGREGALQEAAALEAALRAALSVPATEPERGQGANEAWRFCSHCGAAQWEGGTDPNPNSITLPAVPVASSEESRR